MHQRSALQDSPSFVLLLSVSLSVTPKYAHTLIHQTYMESKNGIYGETLKCSKAFDEMQVSLYGSRNDEIASEVCFCVRIFSTPRTYALCVCIHTISHMRL